MRRVQLAGEAFFEVRKGAAFSVETPEGRVEVLGTSFNVFARDKVLEVACYTGVVRVTAGGEVKRLTAGQAFRKQEQSAGKETNFQPETQPSWTTGVTYFEKTVLEDVFKEFERQFDVKVRMENGQQERYTGRLLHADQMETMQEICRIMGLKFRIEQKEFIVY